MSWKAIDRCTPVVPGDAQPALSDAVKAKIRSLMARYETKRAALLPALHIVQGALGHIGPQAMKEIAQLLELTPGVVLDTMSFYTHFWDHPKGLKVVVVCRSLSCDLLGGRELLKAVKAELGIEEHGTTPDGQYSLLTEECLAACDGGPCMLVNEKLHTGVRPEDVPRILRDPANDHLDVERSTLFDGPTS